MKCIIYCTALFVSFFLPSLATVTINLPQEDISVDRLCGSAQYSERDVFGEPGQPSLPVYVYSVLLPPDADLKSVSISIEGMKESLLAGQFEIQPVLPPKTSNGIVGWPNERNIENGRDISVYSQNAIYPQNHIKVMEIGQLSCFKLVTVKVSKLRYNPVEKTVYQLEQGTLKIDYTKDAQYSRERAGQAKIPVEVVERLKRNVSNYDEFINNYATDYSFVGTNCLAIITTKSIKTQLKNFDAFVTAKKAMKFTVIEVTEDIWGGGTGTTGSANIRKWLQDNYQAKGINYALLIGNPSNSSGDVPMGWFVGYSPWSGHTDCPADWHYAQLTGDYKSDNSCELHVGRIPIFAGDYTSTDAIILKTINYGNAKVADATWRYNILMGGPGYDASSTSWGSMNPAYDSWIKTTTDWKAFRCYSSMYATPVAADLVSSDISPTWAAGKYGLVDWCAHGASTLAQGAMTSANTTKVGNNYPAFVNCASCSNAAITTASNLTYSILKNCGIGAMGGTDYTMVGDDMNWSRYFVNYMVTSKMTAGQAMTQLKAKNSSGWYNRGPYVLYGDPTVGIYSNGDGTSISGQNALTESAVVLLTHSENGSSIRFQIQGMGTTPATLSIYSASGALLKAIMLQSADGSHVLDGSKLGTGMYIARLTIRNQSGVATAATTKITVTK